MVVGSSCYGVFLWRLKPVVAKRSDGSTFKCLVLNLDGDDDDELDSIRELVEFVVVADDKWRLADATIVPPADLRPNDFADKLSFTTGPLFLPMDFMPLLQFSALRAFPGLTMPLLQKLARRMGLEFQRGDTPRSLSEWLRACITHILPKLTDEQVGDIVSSRVAAPEANGEDEGGDLMGGILDLSSMALFTGVVDADDMQAIKHVRKQRYEKSVAAKVAERRAAARAAPKPSKQRQKSAQSSAAASSSSSAGVCVPCRRLPVPADYTAAAFQHYMPDVPGARLHLEKNWHTRWRASYPSSTPPMGCSRNFNLGDPPSIRSALVECVRWAWSRHEADGGEACPWDLGN